MTLGRLKGIRNGKRWIKKLMLAKCAGLFIYVR
mgnify:CR=1 FL=1